MRTITKKLIIPTLVLAFAASLLSAAEIEGTVSANGEELKDEGPFTVISPGISPPLDEKTYESRIIHYLTDKGMVYAPDDPRAIKVSYTYSIDKGRVGTVAAPVYGPTGYSSFFYGSGGGWHHHHGGGWGIGFGAPVYGPVAVVPQQVTVFTRQLILSFASPKGKLLQQVTLVSPGPEGDLHYVMPAMIHAALKKYPMEPGQRKEVSADIE